MAEEYVGIKYSLELGEGVREAVHAGELINWCRKFHKMGIASVGGPAGNISVRTKRGFLITPGGQNFSTITADQLVEVVEVNEENHTIKAIGIMNPSSESFLHGGIYAARKDVNAVLHGHNNIVTANSEKFEIPETKIEQQYGTEALRDEVLNILGSHWLVQMKNHGFISLGKSLSEAGKQAIGLYEKSRNSGE